MKTPIYQVDAFTSERFRGNPAAVCPLDEWLDDATMQNIAAENNLSETAFFVKQGNKYHIRWMTPTNEVDLCGHATLASSFVIFNYLEKNLNEIIFTSRSGKLSVSREKDLIKLNFPANKPKAAEAPPELKTAFGELPAETYFNKTYIAVYDSEKFIRDVDPDIKIVSGLKSDGIIITAPSREVDFVSRYFVPQHGINEDPVTGYAHTLLTPLWSEKLGKNKLKALQVSGRGGELFLENLGERVIIAGRAVLYLEGVVCL